MKAVKKAVEGFQKEREANRIVLSNEESVAGGVTEETMKAANMYFNSYSQDFKCGQLEPA